MQLPQFNEQHAQQLSAFLSTQPQAMSLTQSQGYLFGVICSPSPLEVHQWLAHIVPNTANTYNMSNNLNFLECFRSQDQKRYRILRFFALRAIYR